jgi:hypothetical protein
MANQIKILIIGLGNMGLSHFKAFSHKKFIINIYDKDKSKTVSFLKSNKLLLKNLNILDQIPNSKKYFLTICSTKSFERFKLVKKFLSTNKTKFLLLEKFCFFSITDFNNFNKYLKYKTQTFVNSYGYILANKVYYGKKFKNLKITCYIQEGHLIAGLTHFVHFFLKCLNNNEKILHIKKNIKRKFKSTKDNFYDEIKGDINFYSNSSELNIKTKKKINNFMEIYIQKKNSKIIESIFLNKKNLFIYKNFQKKEKRFPFPFSKKTTYVFLKKLLIKDFNYLPSFDSDYYVSKKILKSLKLKII